MLLVIHGLLCEPQQKWQFVTNKKTVDAQNHHLLGIILAGLDTVW